jgi:flagellar biosynthetic protein FliO
MTASTLGLFVRLVFSLAVVIGIMWMAANMIKRRGLAPADRRRNGRGVHVELLARRPLGRNASIAVVRVGERSMVVGVTEHQVTKLDDADIDEIEEINLSKSGTSWTVPTAGATGPASPWKTMLDQLRDRTARR